MTEINCDALKSHILSASGKETLTPKEELLVRTYCLGKVCLICEWILGKHVATPEEIVELYENSLPELLKQHLI